jgi:hypothetical protein
MHFQRLQSGGMKEMYSTCLVVHLNINSFDNLQNFLSEVNENERLNMHIA